MYGTSTIYLMVLHIANNNKVASHQKGLIPLPRTILGYRALHAGCFPIRKESENFQTFEGVNETLYL